MENTQNGFPELEMKPFLIVLCIWSILGAGVSLFFSGAGFLWYLAALSLALMNLFFLVKTIAVLVVLVSDHLAEKKLYLGIQALFWASMKLATLGAIILLIYKAQNAPKVPLMMGVGTTVIVPLFGGFLWSQKGLGHA